MKRLTLLFAALALLLPSVAWGAGEDCTLGEDEALDWGTIGVITSNGGNCEEAARVPDGDDVIIIPSGSVVTIIDEILFTTIDAAIVCDGGEIIFSGTGAVGAVGIRVFDGVDTQPTASPVANVAFYASADCTITIAPGYLEWGPSTEGTPVRVATTTATNDTVWTWGSTDPCDSSVDCAADTDQTCSEWTDARYNLANGGAAGDHFIDESVDAINSIVDAGADAASDMACFTSGAERGWCYPIESGTDGASDSTMCLNVRQSPFSRWAEDPHDVPFADREILFLDGSGDGVSVAIAVGDTCVTVDDPVIVADGDYAGRHLRMGDALLEAPKKLTRTYDNINCAGEDGDTCSAAGVPLACCTGDGTDTCDGSIYVAPEAAFTKAYAVADSDSTIGYGMKEGDKFVVVAGLHISADASLDPGEAKMLIESTSLDVRGLFTGGLGTVKLTSTSGNFCANVIDGGDNGVLAALHYDSVSNPVLDCVTVMGGDYDAGGADVLVFEDTTGIVSIRDSSFRYNGAYSIQHAGTEAGVLDLERVKFEYMGDVVATDAGAVLVEASGFSAVRARNIACTDCTVASAAGSGVMFDVLASVTAVFDKVSIWGHTTGHVVELNTAGTLIKMSNLLMRGSQVSTLGGNNRTYLPSVIKGCDIRGVSLVGAAQVGHFIIDTRGTAPLTLPGDISNCVFADITTTRETAFTLMAVDAFTFRNNILWDIDVGTIGPDTAATIIQSHEPNDTAKQIIEDITIGWTATTATGALTALAIEETGSGHASNTSTRLGSILVTNMLNTAAAAGTVYAYDIADDLMSHAGTTYAGPFCVQGGSATGGAAWADFDDIADYDTDFLNRGFGWPVTVDTPGGDYSLERGSLLADKGCGAKTGGQAPGVVRGTSANWIKEANGIQGEWAVLRNKSRAY